MRHNNQPCPLNFSHVIIALYRQPVNEAIRLWTGQQEDKTT